MPAARLSGDEFLTALAKLYEAPNDGRKGTVAIACKSVSSKQVGRMNGDHVLLFRAVKYGNNKHKTKISTLVAAGEHARFHAQLSQIVKVRAAGKAEAKIHAPRSGKRKQTTE